MKTIEFVNNRGKAPDPIQKSQEAGFKTIIFQEAYRELSARFSEGSTWVRFLPAIKGSIYDWMMPVEVFQDICGTSFASPNTFDANAFSAFEVARRWFQRNEKDALRNKVRNPNGIHLYPKRIGVSWVILEHAPEGERLRLFNKSLYDGSWGGSTGLAYNIRREAEAKDEEPGSKTLGQLVHGDITDPEGGRLVKVERKPSSKSEYTDYNIAIGKNAAPINHFMSLLTDAEMNLITPLEKTIHIPSEDEEKELLRRYIGDAYFNRIFPKASQGWTQEETEAPAKEEAKAPAKASAPVPAPKPQEPEEEPEIASAAKEEKPYMTKEVTAILATGKEGVTTLLQNRHRLRADHLEIVLDSAQEHEMDVSEFGL